MKNLKDIIIEKLKVTKGSYRTGDELFDDVIDALKLYSEVELDVKSLKLNGEYMHDHSHRIGSVDYIYYSNAPTYKKECVVVVLENGILIKINDFKTFKESVFSQIGESPEEILNNILDLLNNEGI